MNLFQLTDPGSAGDHGLPVPRPAGVECNPEPDLVAIQLHNMAALIALECPLVLKLVTLKTVQVSRIIFHLFVLYPWFSELILSFVVQEYIFT